MSDRANRSLFNAINGKGMRRSSSGALSGPASIQHTQAPLPERKPTRQELADKWTGVDCTLDGRPARVLGRLNECATVAGTEFTAAFAFFAWPIVDRVMRNDGHFKS